jgi:hypothetical protein
VTTTYTFAVGEALFGVKVKKPVAGSPIWLFPLYVTGIVAMS